MAGGDGYVLGRDHTLTFAAVLDVPSGKVILAVYKVWSICARRNDGPCAYVEIVKE